MTDRYTRKEANGCAERLAKIVGKQFGNCHVKDPSTESGWRWIEGCWTTDYNTTYGGIKMVEIMERGAQSDILGERRRSPREFCEAVWFAEKVLDIDRKRPTLT